MSITPDEPAAPARGRAGLKGNAREALRGGGRVLGLMILALMGFMVLKAIFNPGGYLSFDPTILFAFALVGAGVLLLRGQEHVVEGAVVERPVRQRSPLGILTLSAVFLVSGLVILLGNLGVADVSVGQIAAAALVVVGIGLLVGAWWGRSRLLILAGLLLIPAVVVGGFIDFPLRGSIGGRYDFPQSLGQLEEDYELLLGSMTLDLLAIEDWSTAHSIDFDVTAGNVTIYVPKRVAVTVTGDIEWGNATIGHGREEGEDLHFSNVIEGKPGAGELEINFHGGIASLYIERISHRERFGKQQPQPGQEKDDRGRADSRSRNEDRTKKSEGATKRRDDSEKA